MKNSGNYPRSLAKTVSALMVLDGIVLMILGGVAMYQKASYSEICGGIWAGVSVTISGVLGSFSAKSPRTYVAPFLAASSFSMMSCVVVIIYATTGLVKDSGFPNGFVLDSSTGERVPVSQVDLRIREGAMMANLLLIVCGVLDIVFGIPAFIITLRELCDCYDVVQEENESRKIFIVDDPRLYASTLVMLPPPPPPTTSTSSPSSLLIPSSSLRHSIPFYPTITPYPLMYPPTKRIRRTRRSRKPRRRPTDSDLERSYTGLDRELAEEFIQQTMMNPSDAW